FGRSLRTPQPVDRRHGERKNLRIVGKRVDHAQPLVEIEQRRNAADALAHVLLRRRRLQHAGEEALRKEVIEGVDVAQAESYPRFPPGQDGFLISLVGRWRSLSTHSHTASSSTLKARAT